ncbi:hypothetical protein [Larsenimonas suaedae]|uniref:Phage tail protein n=1 Tax=Larsenimonas suaedae TaxID=1851019 RepID=A0ABU1GZ30_9GAMM|nr:hypothetical protein [Larsenimonas suaedae]MCM2973791.1 hypothetical protein [Larsenimonas suaedae]MDR5897315.1 hypothetical protein [Larsenimonas suaedae]
MTTNVTFQLITPDGKPFSNASVAIQLTGSGFASEKDGVVVPTSVDATTDENGHGSVDLYPVEQYDYVLTATDAESGVSIRHEFYVPDSDEPVHLADLIMTPEPSNTSYDEAAIQKITQHKIDAQHARDDALNYSGSAGTSATAAADSAMAASNSALTATNAISGLTTLRETTSKAAVDSQVSAANAANSASNAKSSETNAAAAQIASASSAAAAATSAESANQRASEISEKLSMADQRVVDASDSAASAADSAKAASNSAMVAAANADRIEEAIQAAGDSSASDAQLTADVSEGIDAMTAAFNASADALNISTTAE